MSYHDFLTTDIKHPSRISDITYLLAIMLVSKPCPLKIIQYNEGKYCAVDVLPSGKGVSQGARTKVWMAGVSLGMC
jgi:hypothetical protein